MPRKLDHSPELRYIALLGVTINMTLKSFKGTLIVYFGTPRVEKGKLGISDRPGATYGIKGEKGEKGQKRQKRHLCPFRPGEGQPMA